MGEKNKKRVRHCASTVMHMSVRNLEAISETFQAHRICT